jgi:hypothetical protein
MQCENVITPPAEQTGENTLPGRKGGKAQAKPLTPEQRKASATKASKALSSPARQVIRQSFREHASKHPDGMFSPGASYT